MDLRAPLTSATLQARHPGAYRRLLERCETVVSVPLAFSLTGDRTYAAREAGIVHQLPRRIWVGVDLSGEGSFEEFDVTTDAFVEAPAYLRERLRDAAAQSGIGVVRVLAETTEGRNMAVSGTLAAGLAVLVATREGEGAFPPGDLTSLIDRGRTMQRLLRPGSVLGTSVVSALAGKAAQLVCFTAGAPTLLPPPERVPHDLMDLAVLWSGARNDLGLDPELRLDDARLQMFLGDLTSKLPPGSPITRPLIGAIDAQVAGMRDRLFLDLVRCWTELWTCRTREHSTRELLAALHRRASFMEATEQPHPSIAATLAAVRGSLGGVAYAAMPLGAESHGGSVLLAAASGDLRDRMEHLLARMAEEGFSAAGIEYLSWRDGSGDQPPVLEQDLLHGITHPLLRGVRERRVYVSAGGRQVVLADPMEDVKADVVVDASAERLQIGGAPLCARELPSQRMASIVLAAILERPGLMIRNDQLPVSSYRSARSELVSKVLSPLRRTVQVRTGQDLVLRTQGTQGAYTVSLRSPGLRICLRSSLPA